MNFMEMECFKKAIFKFNFCCFSLFNQKMYLYRHNSKNILKLVEDKKKRVFFIRLSNTQTMEDKDVTINIFMNFRDMECFKKVMFKFNFWCFSLFNQQTCLYRHDSKNIPKVVENNKKRVFFIRFPAIWQKRNREIHIKIYDFYGLQYFKKVKFKYNFWCSDFGVFIYLIK